MFYFKACFSEAFFFFPLKTPSLQSLLLPKHTGVTEHRAVASKVPDKLLRPA